MAQLVFLKEDKQALHYPLRKARVTIGRHPDCEVTLEGADVSRDHAVISYKEGYYHIKDQSKNGTFVNGSRVDETRLKSQDVIAIGEWRLKFLEDAPTGIQATETVTTAAKVAPKVDSSKEFAGMIGATKEMRGLFSLIGQVASSSAAVLILGETGTGKELIAGALHNLSKRAKLPFVAVNCAAISASLVESELFGHEKGAFTGAVARHPGAFEQAGRGTIFLDEIGELSLDLQSKFLRALEVRKIKRVGGREEIPVHCRIVAATHRDLVEAVREKKFREDLYYRLFVMPLDVPPLRKRRDDIPLLVEAFLREMQPEGPLRISRDAIKKLKEHLWPGNIRELKNVVLRAALLARGGKILPENIVFLPHAVADVAGEPKTIAEMERQMIQQKLEAHDWNKAAAARELGIAVSTMFKKIREYGLGKK